MSKVGWWQRMMMVGSVCAAAPAVSAQQRPVTVLVKSVWLRGTVFDTLGSPVSGATVSLRLTATTPVLTDSEGHYALLAPRQMTVALQVTRSGFPTLVTRLVLPTADSLTADLYLKGAVVSLPMAAGSTAPDSAARLVVSPLLVPASVPRTSESQPVAIAPSGLRREPWTLRGVVTDTLGHPLFGAVVSVVSQQRATVTDSLGRFVFTRLVAGAVLIRVRRVGFQPRNVTTTVSAVDAVLLDLPLLALGQVLAKVTVISEGAPNNPKLQGFFDRKKFGFGQYLTRDQFSQRLLPRFTDIVNRFSGVVAAEDSRGRRRIYGRGRCEMSVYLDGMHIIIPENTSVDDFLNIDEIDAVEVHTGVAQLPPEFSGRTNACGVVAAWTRSKVSR